MKLRIFALIIVSFSLTFCSKHKMTPDEGSTKPMSSLAVPPGFNWEMTRNLTFLVTGKSNTIVKITSADGNNLFHKTIIPAGLTETIINLSLPSVINEVMVNSQKVTLGQNIITVPLSLKESLASNNKGLQFNGTTQRANIHDKPEHDGGVGEFTCEAWVKTNDKTIQGTHNRRIFAKDDGVNGFSACIDPIGGKVEVRCNGTVGANLSTTSIDDNVYHHVAITRNGTTIRTYIDGVLEATNTDVAFGLSVTTPAEFCVGVIKDGVFTDGHWNGDVDEIRYWNKERSGVNILADHNKKITGSNVDFVNLKGSWDCDEPVPLAGKAKDRTSYGNDADLEGGCVPIPMPIPPLDGDGDGVTDDNDDYPADPLRAFNNYFPAVTPGTLAFEDLWPGTGDYDFNDLVVDYRFQTVTNAQNKVVEIFCRFNVIANGASLHNGFGFELPDATVLPGAADIDVTGYNISGGVVTLAANHTESGQAKPTFIVFSNTHDLMTNYTNTMGGSPFIPAVPITLTIPVSSTNYLASAFSISTWNPFMFVNQNRGWEIHKLDFPPTSLVNYSLYGQAQDVSNIGLAKYYLTANNLPWVLDFPTTFSYPLERCNIRWAYLHFEAWAESGGVSYPDWYSNLGVGYRNNSKIFTP